MSIPTLLELAVDGASVALRFSEALTTILPSINRFAVLVNGVRIYASSTNATLSNGGTTLRFSLRTPVPPGATVVITYTSVNGADKPGFGDLRSASTNERAAFFRASTTANLSGTATTPTVAITSSTAALIAGQTTTITFTFSRDPGTSFSNSDITLAGGTLSTITGTGLTRTATFTPTAASSGTASITVAAGSYTDVFGNSGGGGTTPALTYDTLAPTLAITSSPAALMVGESGTITFTFSETPAGFTAVDIITSGGNLTGLAVTADPKVYTATLTADSSGTASLSVAAGSYTDAAGNAGGASFYVAAGTLAISSLGSGDVLAVAEGAMANADISAIGFTATSQTSNAGSVSITTNGYAVNLANATGPSGYAVTNTGAATTLIGSPLDDSITGGVDNDTITGGVGDDILNGGGGDDTFNVDANIDFIYDLDTGDVMVVSSAATVNAYLAGSFTATSATSNAGNASLSSPGYTVNLGSATGPNGYSVTNTGAGATFTGSTYDDTLTGNTGNDTLNGGAGNDTLNGGAANDILTGGAGNDSLTGGTGNDTFTVDAGTDTITDLSGTGTDVLKVSSGATASATVTAAFTAGSATSNAGTATLTSAGYTVNLSSAGAAIGTNGYSVTNTGTSATFTGSTYNDTLTGGTNNDTLIGGAGDDSLTGSTGNDTLTGGTGNDTFTVDAGTDTINDLGTGSDVLQVSSGATANATVTAAFTATSGTSNAGTASLSSPGYIVNLGSATGPNGYSVTNTGAGATFTGSTYDDTLTGNTGNDTLNGGAGNDTLSGGAGNDALTGGAGDDSLTGGTGSDTFNVVTGTDTITDLSGTGTDVLKVSSGATAIATVTAAFTASSTTSNAGTATLSSNGFNVILGAAGSATGTNGYSVTNTGAAATFSGSRYNDTLTGGTGNDFLSGGLGNDILTGSNGIDTLTGSPGADTFIYTLVDALISGIISPSFERITDLAIGTDSLDGPNLVSAANVQQLGDVGSSLTSDSITALLTTTNFLASGASTFTFDSGAGLRTFIALNDATAGYSSTLDGIIEITGYTGTLTNLAIV